MQPRIELALTLLEVAAPLVFVRRWRLLRKEKTGDDARQDDAENCQKRGVEHHATGFGHELTGRMRPFSDLPERHAFQ